jgi:hypothetical protein
VNESDRDSTVARLSSRSGNALSKWASRAFILVLFLACVAGGIGLLGGRTGTATGAGHGYRVSLLYPRTSRPGLDTLWRLQVVHNGGFHAPVTITVSASYFELFETQGFYPTPQSTTSSASAVSMTFKPPRHGDTLRVLYDSYLQPYVAPSNLLANHAAVSVIVHHKRVVTVPYTTWVLP